MLTYGEFKHEKDKKSSIDSETVQWWKQTSWEQVVLQLDILGKEHSVLENYREEGLWQETDIFRNEWL